MAGDRRRASPPRRTVGGVAPVRPPVDGSLRDAGPRPCPGFDLGRIDLRERTHLGEADRPRQAAGGAGQNGEEPGRVPKSQESNVGGDRGDQARRGRRTVVCRRANAARCRSTAGVATAVRRRRRRRARVGGGDRTAADGGGPSREATTGSISGRVMDTAGPRCRARRRPSRRSRVRGSYTVERDGKFFRPLPDPGLLRRAGGLPRVRGGRATRHRG